MKSYTKNVFVGGDFMKNKIVFFDIDGTLVDRDKNISPLTKRAITKLQKNNVHVAIATGRPPFMYNDIRKELNIDTYVSFSGQHAVVNGEVIYENPVSKDAIINLYKDAQSFDIPMVFMSGEAMRSTVANHPFVKRALGQLHFDYPQVDLSFPKMETIYQALLFSERQYKNVKRNHPAFEYLRWHECAVDILPAGGSKMNGVNAIMKTLNLDHANSYAIGDGMNDLEMIESVGTGIAMGNAVKPLKERADRVTYSVNDDGVYYALKDLKLI